MNITLDNFEQYIDETILKRGLQYYKKGYVTNVDELGDGEYEALVEGSEEYTVNLTVKKGVLSYYSCTCPYDMGPVCKHVVATLFCLQKDAIDLDRVPVNTSKPKPEPKKKSPTAQVKEILKDLPVDELKEFIVETCKRDKEFRLRFLNKFGHVNSPLTKSFFVSHIKSMVDIYSVRHGYIGYHEAGEMGKNILSMLEAAKINIDKGRYNDAGMVIMAILEAVPVVLNSADDSSGYLGSTIDFAFELMNDLISEDIDKPLRDEIFEYLVGAFESKKLRGWGWDFDMLSLAIDLIETPQETERIRTLINTVERTDKNWDWGYQRAQQLMRELIDKTAGDENTVLEYLRANISNPDFREELIQRAIADNKLEEALELTKEGIETDKKSPGIINKWIGYQLEIYKILGDNEKIIRLANYFFVDSHSSSRSLKDYYDLLKATIPADQWSNYLEEVITKLKAQRWIDYDKLISIFIWEEFWDRYLALLESETTLSRIHSAEKYLAGSFTEKLLSLYRKAILVHLEKNVGRNHYVEVCRYIKRMNMLGGRVEAEKLIVELRTKYKNRKALLEELDGVR